MKGERAMTYPGMVDKTGQPRSDKDLQDAINAVTEIMVKHATVLPLFTVHATIIRDCLLELQRRRKAEQ